MNFSLFQKMDQKIDSYIILTILFCVSIFLHLYKIDQVPLGLHIDEAGMAYDAWSLAQTGTDRWLNSWPVYLNNTGNGQSILYCMLCSFLFHFCGVSFLTIRFPAILFSMLTYIFGVKLVKLYWRGDILRLVLVALLFVLVPYFTQNGRYGLDCNLMLGTSAIFFYFFSKAAQMEHLQWFLISGICAGLVLYSYIISYIVISVFLFVSFLYFIFLKKLTWKNFLTFTIPLAIFAFPLILVQIVNIFQLENIHIGIFSINKLSNYRTSEFTVNHILSNFIQTLKCMVRDGELIFDAFPQYGTFYLISIPFIGIGGISAFFKAFQSLRYRIFSPYFLLLAWVFSYVFIGCFLGGDGPLTYRFNGVFLVLLLLLVEGILVAVNLFRGKNIRSILLTMLLCLYVFCFFSFFKYYFFVYPSSIYPQYGFQPALFDVIEYNQFHQDELKDHPIYLCLNHSAAEYYGLAAQILPSEYYKDGRRDPSGYQNTTFINDSIDKIDPNGYYIVWETYDDFIKKLENHGLTPERKVGHYVYLRKITLSSEKNSHD